MGFASDLRVCRRKSREPPLLPASSISHRSNADEKRERERKEKKCLLRFNSYISPTGQPQNLLRWTDIIIVYVRNALSAYFC
jgi:hypothetical protein